MISQDYIGWARYVNRIILDSTSISVGNNALLEEENEAAVKRSMMRGNFIQDEYSVTMSFDWVNPVADTGKTEYQLFLEWYKYKHKYGTVPFEFPKILYSPNTGIMVYDDVEEKAWQVEYYKITSAIAGSKKGEHVEVSMTWKNYYSGVVSIDTPTPSIVGIDAHTNYADIFFSEISDTAPVSSQFTFYNGDDPLEITSFYYDNNMTVRVYYDTLEHGDISFACSYAGLVVEKGDYHSDF